MILLRAIGFGFLGLLSLCLAGCKVTTECLFTNLSGAPIELTLLARENIQLGTIEPGRSVVIEEWIWHKVRLKQGSAVATYDEPEPPINCKEFSGWGPWEHVAFRAQLRTDGKIHLDCPVQNGSFPVSPGPDDGR